MVTKTTTTTTNNAIGGQLEQREYLARALTSAAVTSDRLCLTGGNQPQGQTETTHEFSRCSDICDLDQLEPLFYNSGSTLVADRNNA